MASGSRFLRCLVAALLVCWLVPARAADPYPSRPIRIVVPFAAGSGSDIIARGLGHFLQDRWKQPVVVENRPGANGALGTEVLRNAAADGYTLGISTNSTHAAAPLLIRTLPYDPLRDFDHISLIGVGGSVALVPAPSPFKSIGELAAFARSHPGEVLFGYADTISQMPGELLKGRAGLPIEGIAYKGIGQVVTDLLAGRIHFAFLNYMTGAAHAAGGRLVPIAISEGHRNPQWPGVPAVAETFPGLEVILFAGVSAPRGLPPTIAAALHGVIQEALADPRFRDPLRSVGLTLVPAGPGHYREFVRTERERWREYVKAAKIEAQ